MGLTRLARRGALWAISTATIALAAEAQLRPPPAPGGRIASLGQPPLWHAQLGFSAGLWLEGPTTGLAQVHAGAYHALMNPVMGLLEGGAEAYAGSRRDRAEAGVRALVGVPYLSSRIGADYSLTRERLEMIVSASTPLRRGGLLTRGSLLRIDWYPMERHSFLLGVTVPLKDPLAGRSRPRTIVTVLAGAHDRPADHRTGDPALLAALDTAAESAEWIRRLTVPPLDQDGRDRGTALARMSRAVGATAARLAARDAAGEERFFHAVLGRAFGLAAGDSGAGLAVAAIARRTLLDSMLLPYDRLLGRQRDGDDLDALAISARGSFARDAARSGVVPEGRMEPVLFAFQRLTEMVAAVAHRTEIEWDDPRLVWLPLQYGLLPEDHDTPEEIDRLLERATGVQFSAGNHIAYVANLAFHTELLRTIRQTQRYHVLWIHDFPTFSRVGFDQGSFDIVVEGYLATLADRVTAYDSTGVLPSFFLFLDEHYYEARKSRLLMSILEHPLETDGAIPGASDADLARLGHALARLRAAVAGSRTLQAEAREYGREWLRNRIKVHVNITNRPDATFWGGGLVSSMFGYPDDVMRDHRKIALRDVREDDPEAGEAIITGMGVGSAYLGPGWDDRSVKIEGPVLLELRQAARELLLSQGLEERWLPEPLRWRPPRPVAPDLVSEDARAALLVNGTGYLAKPLTVAKALFYSLLPAGTTYRVPDSLWNSPFYAALLVGAALRGAHVEIIAPALANAPSAGFPQMSRGQELAERLLIVRDTLREALARSGGTLRIGLYALPPDAAGFASRVERWQAWAAGDTAAAPLRGLASVMDTAALLARGAPSADGRAPRLHQKVQVYISARLWQALLASPEWPQLMRAWLAHRAATYEEPESYDSLAAQAGALQDAARRLYADAARGAPGELLYAIVGSQNQDHRGMFMDGEVGVAFTGAEALVPLADLVFLDGTVTWIEDRAELGRLLPSAGELARRIARATKDGL